MSLPWSEPCPLLLAPMQGLTNRAFRSVLARWSQPTALCTEFVRVRPKAAEPIAASDFAEATARVAGTPLVVQVIGSAEEGVLEATRELVARGVEHLNVNMGCPWGRMTSVLAGGGMFRAPECVAPMLRELRALVPGSLSVKTRAGLDDERQIFSVLPAFAESGVDFLVLHARTVAQKYKGRANHELTREVVAAAGIPVIANGDIFDAPSALRILEETGAAGLMLGRGAVADPLLFARIRGEAPPRPEGPALRRELARYLRELLAGYQELFRGEAQILNKLKEVLAHLTLHLTLHSTLHSTLGAEEDRELARWVKGLKKQRRIAGFEAALAV